MVNVIWGEDNTNFLFFTFKNDSVNFLAGPRLETLSANSKLPLLHPLDSPCNWPIENHLPIIDAVFGGLIDFLTSFPCQDDLWLVSSSISFSAAETFMAKSTWHAPSDNRLEMLALSTPSDHIVSQLCESKQSLVAVRITNMANDFSVLDKLQLCEADLLLSSSVAPPTPFPLFSFILTGRWEDAQVEEDAVIPTKTTSNSINQLLKDFSLEFQLNQSQLRYSNDRFDDLIDLNSLLESFVNSLTVRLPCEGVMPVTLCHGVFGSGLAGLGLEWTL